MLHKKNKTTNHAICIKFHSIYFEDAFKLINVHYLCFKSE
jgi:hypothetical protein